MTSAILFAGQGAQRPGMGRCLYQTYPLARDLYDQACDILGWDLRAVSFEGPENELTETRVCQPALFVHGIALFEILRERGSLGKLRAMLGLSLGEVTALTAAGVFDFSAGLRVVAERGRLMQTACELNGGAMASIIGAGRDEVAALCAEHDIDMANINCPGQIVVSGEKAKVDAAVTAAKKSGFKRVIPLNVAGAYHSRLMEPARAKFAEYLAQIPFSPPMVAVFSNATGKEVRSPDEIREALVRQVVSPVLWENCMRGASELGIDRFIECGPGAILAGLARRIDSTWSVASVSEAEDIVRI